MFILLLFSICEDPVVHLQENFRVIEMAYLIKYFTNKSVCVLLLMDFYSR